MLSSGALTPITPVGIVARGWAADDERDQYGDGVKSLERRAIILQAGVAEVADAQDLKGSGGFFRTS